MVCNRCKSVVKNEFINVGLDPVDIQLGEITLRVAPDAGQVEKLKPALLQHGFELIDDKKSRMISMIKKEVIELIHHRQEGKLKINFSDFLSAKLDKDYHYLSNLFSEVEGTTIEKFIINQRIERAKELLVYDELSLSEIADQLGYSSVAHLSSQFKKVTGLTPSHFKQIRQIKRTPLDEV